MLQTDWPDNLDESTTLRGQAVSRLRDEILSGGLRPGAVIKDVEHAARLGISTIPLREALVQLAAEGLVEMPPNRSKRVSPLSRRALLELYAVYQVLSVQGFEWGFEHLDRAAFRQMEDAILRQKEAIARRAWLDAVKASVSFNAIIYRASNNQQLLRLLTQMNLAFARVSMLLRPIKDRKRNHLVYMKMLDALKKGKKKEAIQLYRSMISELYRLIQLLPEERIDAMGNSRKVLRFDSLPRGVQLLNWKAHVSPR